MRNIKIIRMVLDNFKCHSHLELAFGGQNVSIYGDNATGKTSVYDALTWLLFGKDSAGNGEKNIDIKPLNAAGEVADHNAITSVMAEFEVDGNVKAFKRTFREVWATKRGSATMEYTGNVSDYYVDDVPMKKILFDSAIKDMIAEDVFRMLTSVSYFADAMKWQARRAILFDMAGAMTDQEILEQDARFAPLAEAMGKLDLAGYKAKIQYERKGLMGTRDEIPARISEAQRVLQSAESVNLDETRSLEAALQERIEELSAKSLAVSSDSAAESKRLDLREAKMDRDALERENDRFRHSQNDTQGKSKELTTMLHLAKDKAADLSRYIERENRTLGRLGDELNDLRNKWVIVNGESFTGGVCPTCGQPLPFETLKAKTAEFEQQKKKRLSDLEDAAAKNAQDTDEVKKSIEAMSGKLAHENENIKVLEAQLEDLSAHTKAVTDMDGYAEKMDHYNQTIRILQQEISDMTTTAQAARSEIVAQKQEAIAELRNVQGLLAKADTANQIRSRIAELTDNAKATAEKLETIEQMLYLMEEFTRFKASFVEKSINDLFRIATFRLFREQANGGLEERCDVVYDGVPYMGLNNGMKINVGIDVINTLSRYYGVTVPLFVDNAEGVTRLEQCGAQVIRLVVSAEDKELRLNYEN